MTPRSASASRYPALYRYRNEIARCVRCGACGAVCPAFLVKREESFSARGRMALIEAVLRGALPVSEIFRDRLATCAGCLACDASCPSGVPVTRIIQAAKEEAVRESGPGIIMRVVAAFLSSDAAMRSLAWLAPIALRYDGRSVRGKGPGSRRREPRGQGPGGRGPEHPKPRGRVAFFPGCAIGHFQQDIGRAALGVLNATGHEVIVPDGITCCGGPLLALGDRRAAAQCAERNTAVLSSLGVDAVVTACASCSLTFTAEYPTLLAPSGRKPVPVFDIHEFLARNLDGPVVSSFPVKITWHDPCHLGRGMGLSRTARSILQRIRGVDLTEMENPDRCCGFGGVMRVTHSGLSGAIGAAKAKDIIATGAKIVVTGCPACRMQIADALRRAGSDVEVMHTVQVIEKALGVRRKARGDNPFAVKPHSSVVS